MGTERPQSRVEGPRRTRAQVDLGSAVGLLVSQSRAVPAGGGVRRGCAGELKGSAVTAEPRGHQGSRTRVPPGGELSGRAPARRSQPKGPVRQLWRCVPQIPLSQQATRTGASPGWSGGSQSWRK